MNVQELIATGEGRKVEFKKELPKGAQLARTAVAFANGAGGAILFGVDDQGAVTGVPEVQLSAYGDSVTNSIVNGCAPMVMFDTAIVRLEGRAVLCVTVYPGAQKPYFMKNEGIETGVYVRVACSNRKADREMIEELDRQRRHVAYDEELIYDKRVQDLDLDLLKSDYEKITGELLSDTDAQNLKLICKENGGCYPTVGGVLLCGRSPLHPYVQIKAALFKGNTKADFIDKKVYGGFLHHSIENVMSFLAQHLYLRAHVEGLNRIERYEIPMKALREAVLNAVIHRDYARGGADIKVAIYDDVVEIISPGGFPGNLELSDVLNGRSELRNRVVGRFFERLGWVEHWGTGVMTMVRLCQEAGIDPPLISEVGSAVKVVFKRGGCLPPEEDISDQLYVAEALNEYKVNVSVKKPPLVLSSVRGAAGVDALRSLIERSPGLRSPDLSRELGGVPIKTLERWLSQLRKNQEIEFRGAPKTGGYYLG